MDGYIEEERAQGRLLELTASQAELMGVHCSPFGVIPKKNRPDKWRLILDLSSPDENSVNDGIAKELATVSYVSVDEVVEHILQLGRGTIMAKMDVRQAYRNIPVHSTDRLLLGMKWADITYVDATLPFGLRSAPVIFTALFNGSCSSRGCHGYGTTWMISSR